MREEIGDIILKSVMPGLSTADPKTTRSAVRERGGNRRVRRRATILVILCLCDLASECLEAVTYAEPLRGR